jgi:acetyl-CoA carboxylase biotin carboxyl carrier protein
MALRYDQVADLIKIVDASACEEVVLETPELKLILRRHGARNTGDLPAIHVAPAPHAVATHVAELPATAVQPSAPPNSAKIIAGTVEIRAPMVGTFYRAASPDAAPFVEIGTIVAPGAPLAIIEVMKLFTTVYAETGGRVVDICATNAELVEYGRVIFVIKEVA